MCAEGLERWLRLVAWIAVAAATVLILAGGMVLITALAILSILGLA